MWQKMLFSSYLLYILFTGLTMFSGCAKEYSYEGGIVDTLVRPPLVPDSTVAPGPQVLYCSGCKSSTDPGGLFWNFNLDSSLLCGNITNAVITPQRTGFTFFGPSFCSRDTGLVMTIFLDTADALISDKNNITTSRVSLEYYDNTTQSDILISRRPSMYLTIDSYEHSTGIATGTFGGIVKTKDSTQVPLLDGKFSIKFQ